MGMSRTQKQAEVAELNARFANDELIVLAHNTGLTMPEMTKLRTAARAEGVNFKVTKNSLAKLALKGTKFEGAADLFTGPTGVASSVDAVAAAKVAHNFSKEHAKFVIVGGALGTQVLDVAGIEALAKLPSLDELRSKLIGLLQAPATKLAVVLQTPARNMVGVTAAYGAKGE